MSWGTLPLGAGGSLGAATLAVLSGGSGLLHIRQPDQKQAHGWPKFCQNILDKGKIKQKKI